MIEPKSRFLKRSMSASKFGPVKLSAMQLLVSVAAQRPWTGNESQSVLLPETVRVTERSSARPASAPAGESFRSAPKPPGSVPLRKPVPGWAASPVPA
jgi:hypothetical protein